MFVFCYQTQFPECFLFPLPTSQITHQVKKEVEVLFYLLILDFRKNIAFWKAPRYRPFVFLVRATCT
jgi:hypothetical protein